VVIDNGTGYTKMGFAGNVEPQYIIPTVTASKTDVDSMKGKRDGVEDLDFFIGDKALNNNSTHQINYPIRGGIIDNWDNMERLWSRCMFEYLRCEPEEHYVSILGRACAKEISHRILFLISSFPVRVFSTNLLPAAPHPHPHLLSSCPPLPSPGDVDRATA